MTAPAALSRSLARRLLRDQYRRAGASSWITVIDSRSMAPLVHDTVRAEIRWGAGASSVVAGALVLTNTAGDLAVVHRALGTRAATRGRQVLQMADNLDFGNPYAAAWVDETHVLGAVRQLRRTDGSLLYDSNSHFWQAIDRCMAMSGLALWSFTDRQLSLRASVLRLARLMFMRAASGLWRIGQLGRSRRSQATRGEEPHAGL